MKRSTIELEIAPEIEDTVRVIAEGENCSIESILQEGLALLFGNDSVVEYQLERLGGYSDEQLWAVIHQRLSFAQDRRVRQLMEIGREGKLTPQEESEFSCLLSMIDRQTMLRSRALLLMKERGHDIYEYLNVELVGD